MQKQQFPILMTFGHLCADLNQGVLAAILPFLVAAYHYDYTTAALLVMVSNLVGSIIQPLFGYLADKSNKPYRMTIGVLLAGGGMALTGWLSNFVFLCMAVVISGIGVAMFHPQAAQVVNRQARTGAKGVSIGIFSFGGNLGFTLGPIFATSVMALFGLKGTLIFVAPALIFALVATFSSHRLRVEKEQSENPEEACHGTDHWGEFIKLSALIVFRSIIFAGISTFMVLYFIEALDLSKTTGNSLLSLYYASAAFAAIFGGRLADLFGQKRVLTFSLFILTPSLFLFLWTQQFVWLCCMVVFLGLGISLGYSPMILLGQQYLPNHIGFASGITLGISVSLGGIMAPLLGKIGDLYGLSTTFHLLAFLSLLPLLLSFVIKEPRQRSSAK